MTDHITAGIDVGGTNKGFHLVVLDGTSVMFNENFKQPGDLLLACRKHRVHVVGIDAPCKWALKWGSRAVERALAKQKMHLFWTPTRERAQSNKKGYYDWMFNGERAYQALAAGYPLLEDDKYSGGSVCFETFPHAIACAMLGIGVASARLKRIQRRQILEEAGIDHTALKSIDAVDAALCALTAQHLLDGRSLAFGGREEGFIRLPIGREI